MEKLNVWRSISARSLLVCKVQSSRLSFGVLFFFLNFLHFFLDILEGKSLCCCCKCLSGDKEKLKKKKNRQIGASWVGQLTGFRATLRSQLSYFLQVFGFKWYLSFWLTSKTKERVKRKMMTMNGDKNWGAEIPPSTKPASACTPHRGFLIFSIFNFRCKFFFLFAARNNPLLLWILSTTFEILSGWMSAFTPPAEIWRMQKLKMFE